MPAWLTRLNHYLPIRYGVWLLCVLAALLSAYLWWRAGANLGLRLLPLQERLLLGHNEAVQ